MKFFRLILRKNQTVKFFFRAEVSKGTYLRTLADEFGRRLGSLGYLSSLRRTQSGEFNIRNAVSFHEVENSSPDEIIKHLIQPEETLSS